MTSPITPEAIAAALEAIAGVLDDPACLVEAAIAAALTAAAPHIAEECAKAADEHTRWIKANAFGSDSIVAVDTGDAIAARIRSLATTEKA